MRSVSLIVVFAFGLVLAVGGGLLLSLGGSGFYLFSGVLLLATGWGLLRRAAWALPLYATWLLALLVWSLWESGWSWWPLATRLGVPVLLGLWLASPWVRRALASRAQRVPSGTWLGASAVLVAVVAFASLLRDPYAIKGELPMADVSAHPALGSDALAQGQWPAYGGSHYGQRYSPLAQITPDNVGRLQLAWSVQTGDVKLPTDVTETTYQATPLKIGDTLYLCTPHNWAMALNADDGSLRWKFDPAVGVEANRQHQTCRGVSYFDAAELLANATAQPPAPALCTQRIFLPTSDAKLYALDADTGERCPGFGDAGVIDLLHNMPFKQPGFYYSTSPPLVAAGKVIVAGAVNDNYALDEPSGVIRAYDAVSGALLWNWDAGNPEATAPLDIHDPTQVYTSSSPNSWSIASADEALGLAYFPMGSRTPDQLSMYRNAEENRYATSVVALDLGSGQARWVHQFVHLDLWDMDTPAQPSLIDLDMPGGPVPALVIPTKQGDVYVLDRRDGSAVLPVGSRPAPQVNDIPGQVISPQQPYSSFSFEPPPLREADMWGASLIDQMLCRIQFRKLNYEGRYTPPTLKGSLVYPGNTGVFNWGSVAVDPQRQVMFGMPVSLAFVSRLIPREQVDAEKAGQGEQGINLNTGAPYAVSLSPFVSPLGVPCQQPPWGSIAAADLRSGRIAYRHRNGTIRDMAPLPVPVKMGVPGLGGPLILRSGVVFMAAAVDDNFRAYDLATGKVLWNVRIPAGGQATPMTYLDSQGRQMVVLVAGGHGSLGTRLGDYVVAYALPQ